MKTIPVTGKFLHYTLLLSVVLVNGRVAHQVFLCAVIFGFLLPVVQAQPFDVPYVPTTFEVVDKMLEVAGVGPGDYLIDLGSGDGRIVIAAALKGAYSHGVDINPVRIREANENAKRAGLNEQVVFVEGNIFETDISHASVVTMYLLSSVNLKLRSTLLEKLKPGSRVVSHDFDMKEWNPDKFFMVNEDRVYFWIIPARVRGQWKWKTANREFSMLARQEFQELDLKISAGNTELAVEKPVLAGERISFRAIDQTGKVTYNFSGHVDGKIITGTVQIHQQGVKAMEDWKAERKENDE